MKNEFKNISKFSEKSVGSVWKNQKDDIWSEYLNKKSNIKLRPEFIKRLNKTRKGKYITFKSIEELREKTEKS